MHALLRLSPLLCLGTLSCSLGHAEPDGRVSPPQADLSLALPGAPPRQPTSLQLATRLSVQTHSDLPADAPNVVVHVPEGFVADGVRLVVYLHGWGGCAAAVPAVGEVDCRPGGERVHGWELAAEHDAVGSNSLLVVPQLAWLANSGNPGAFSRAGVADAWLDALVGEVLQPELGLVGPEAIDEIVIVAHSGGYMTAGELVEHAEAWPLRSVVLLDALYGRAGAFAAWASAAEGRQVVSLHTPHPGTTSQSRRLADVLEGAFGADAVARDPDQLGHAVASHRVVVSRTAVSHGAVPREHLREVLTGLSEG